MDAWISHSTGAMASVGTVPPRTSSSTGAAINTHRHRGESDGAPATLAGNDASGRILGRPFDQLADVRREVGIAPVAGVMAGAEAEFLER